MKVKEFNISFFWHSEKKIVFEISDYEIWRPSSLQTQGASPSKLNLIHKIKSNNQDLRLSNSRAHLIKYNSYEAIEHDLRNEEMPDVDLILEKAKELYNGTK